MQTIDSDLADISRTISVCLDECARTTAKAQQSAAMMRTLAAHSMLRKHALRATQRAKRARTLAKRLARLRRMSVTAARVERCWLELKSTLR